MSNYSGGSQAVATTPIPASQLFAQHVVATLPDPWALAFLPGGSMLVTERPSPGNLPNPTDPGHIRLVTQAGAVSAALGGVPDNVGVLDVVLAPDFATSHMVYFSYLERDPDAPRFGRGSDPATDPAGVAVARAVLDMNAPGGPTLTDTSVIWHQLPKVVSDPGSGEPGGRITFSPDGEYLYISSGDREEFQTVQELDNNVGKIIRLYADGTVPTDNPFADVATASADIWSTGHRNPYGLMFDANGVLWQNEMGPKGGDELNIIVPGANYGWPNVSYGNFYDGGLIAKPAPGDGYEGSVLWWTPVIAPSDMIQYTGDSFPQWKGDFIISGLQSKGLVIVSTDDSGHATEVARVDLGQRTRAVMQGPDGSLWVLFDQPDGRLVQLSPLAAPTSSGNPIEVTVTPSALPTNIAQAALTAGTQISVRAHTADGTTILEGQFYTADGQKGGVVTIASGAAGDIGAATVAGRPGGGFVVAYGARVDGVFHTYLQTYDALGVASGARVTLDSGGASFHAPPAVTILADGRIATTWLGTGALDVTDVRAQIFAADGTRIGGEIVVSDHAEASKTGEALVALSGGGFAVAWTDYGVEQDAYGNADTAVRAQIFDAAGAKVGGAFTINSLSAGNQDQVTLAARTGGGFVAVWRDDGQGYDSVTGSQGIWAQTIAADGTKIGAAVHVSDAGDYGFAPSVTALPGVGYAIVWQEASTGFGGARTVMARLLDSDAHDLGPAFILADDASTGMPEISATTDGHVLFGWTGTADPAAGFKVMVATSATIDGTDQRDLILGTHGNDLITGGAGADLLIGDGGHDIFAGTIHDLAGDAIADFTVDDVLRFTDASLGSGFTARLAGNVLSFTGGTITLSDLPLGAHVIATSHAGGGVDVALLPATVTSDFDGNGRSDILWRATDGRVGAWLADASGGFPNVGTIYGVTTDWKIAGTGDFNADGHADILWRNADGRIGDWFGGTNGTFAVNPNLYAASTDWTVAGTGDFNGDGRTDILWRNADGRVGTWSGDANGNFTADTTLYSAGNDWKIAGTGDFNGDGLTDIFWRNTIGQVGDWLADANGHFTPNATLSAGPSNWHVAETGDFNGDGRTDILWRSDSGQVGDWLADANGNFTPNATLYGAPLDWKIVEVGDYNGDGHADILWRNAVTGQTGDWLADANGNFTPNATLYAAPTDWAISSDHSFLV